MCHSPDITNGVMTDEDTTLCLNCLSAHYSRTQIGYFKTKARRNQFVNLTKANPLTYGTYVPRNKQALPGVPCYCGTHYINNLYKTICPDCPKGYKPCKTCEIHPVMGEEEDQCLSCLISAEYG